VRKSLQQTTERETSVEPDGSVQSENDARSPLERFRTRPKKALSVTDLVSPAWCELQYFYTMKYHGKKKRTPAMKQGSVVHQKLEDQVYTTVQVDVRTKEDAWGLRIWNVIQGLQTLRELGHTRELEVWGTVDGQVVNGVIDEISFICPDNEMEHHLKKVDSITPHTDQRMLENPLKGAGESPEASANGIEHRPRAKKIYICDVKTRGSSSLPSDVAMRSTKYQLMLYHCLISALVTNSVNFTIISERYSLDADTQFSDSFIAQVGSLNDRNFYDVSSSLGFDGLDSSQDSMTMLLAHNSLNRLWSLMISEFQSLLPHGRDSIGNVLKVEYRTSSTGRVMGTKTFPMDEKVLQQFVDHEMQWWKGERKPAGVVIQEAYKCRSCDFADQCEWRLARAEEAKQNLRRYKTVQWDSQLGGAEELW
jgi:exonuclease V